MPRISHLKNVMVLLVCCFNIDEHKKWSKNYSKVKAVTNNSKEALMVSKKLLEQTMKMKIEEEQAINQ